MTQALAHQAPQSILVRAPNWTGDVIMATPGFRALRKRFPQARIVLQLRQGLGELLSGAPWFDEIIAVDSYRSGPLAQWRDAKVLRAKGPFDLGICLPDSFAAAFVMRLAGVRHVIGYRRGWRRPLLHQAVALPGAVGKRVLLARERHVLGLMEAAGVAMDGTQLELHTTAQELRKAEAAMEMAGASLEQAFVVLAPGASFGSSKCWPAESFAGVADRLVGAGLQVVVIGTPAERPLTQAVVRAMHSPAIDLGGVLTLGTLKALLSKAKLLVCNDAGARHIGVAFGVPCVVMMGPTALEKTNLNLEHVSVLTADVGCRPCYLRECPIDHRCMTRIPVDIVFEESMRALREGPAFVGVQQELPEVVS